MTWGRGRPGAASPHPGHHPGAQERPQGQQAQAGRGSEPCPLLTHPLRGCQGQAGPGDLLWSISKGTEDLRSPTEGVRRARTPTPGWGLCVGGQGSAWPGFRGLGPAGWMRSLGLPPNLLVCPWLSPPAPHTHSCMPQGPELVGQQLPRGSCLPSIFNPRSGSLRVEFQTALQPVEQMTLSEGIKAPAQYPSKHGVPLPAWRQVAMRPTSPHAGRPRQAGRI